MMSQNNVFSKAEGEQNGESIRCLITQSNNIINTSNNNKCTFVNTTCMIQCKCQSHALILAKSSDLLSTTDRLHIEPKVQRQYYDWPEKGIT